MAAKRITTTSFALLGLLSIRPWTTYELASQMRRNFRFFWPRAESNLYTEPKRLVEGGWATAESRPVGRRRRTIYSISPKGRKALERWLTQQASPSRLEAEPLVKFAFAANSDKAHVLENLRRFHDDAITRQDNLRSIFGEYVREQDPFPQRVHINVVIYQLLWEHACADANWASWALGQVSHWRRTDIPQGREGLMRVLQAALNDSGEARGRTAAGPQVAP